MPSGVLEAGEIAPLNTGLITEETAYTFLNGGYSPRHPLEGSTDPEPDKPGAYSWTKAPRYEGRPAEVGPLARMLIARDPLITDFVARRGLGVMAREVARLHEMILLLTKLEDWMSSIDPGQPFYERPRGFYGGTGTGIIEAARGSLGHWVVINEARVSSYQVITPTAWNGSPRDGRGVAGPIEQALEGIPVEDPANPVELAHVVRSFDPCLACSVHTIRLAR
jgi:hydrogenase large subunit